ncbi:MAG: hypothetical protein JWO78_918 [Micavibrio sp.]|nr:hypothetical protein [Micavibrio sp.]
MQLNHKNGDKPMIDARAQSSQSSRLEALRVKHLAMSNEIKEDRKHPAFDDIELKAKKLRRLKLKDEILQTRQTS